jgi:uncharacterized SAM-binding protein YcdF (DUF218 family)
MLFYLSKATSLFFEPITVIFIILLISALLLLSGRYRWALLCLGATIVTMAFIMFTPFDFWILNPLESRFPLPTSQSCLDGIIMLGGGEDILSSERLGTPLITGAPMRYVVLSKLMHRYPMARVVFAGGSGLLGRHRLTEADISKAIMKAFDLDLSHVVFESNSRTTYENALNAKALVQPMQGQRWALLAPAAQLPRAVGSFRANGWTVLPWPTDYNVSAPVWWPQSLVGRFGAIAAGEHEWFGLIAYRITGRTSEIFPGPKFAPLHCNSPSAGN